MSATRLEFRLPSSPASVNGANKTYLYRYVNKYLGSLGGAVTLQQCFEKKQNHPVLFVYGVAVTGFIITSDFFPVEVVVGGHATWQRYKLYHLR